jgi:hypothetical protein
MNYLRINKTDRAGAAEISQLLWQATVLLGLVASGVVHAFKF